MSSIAELPIDCSHSQPVHHQHSPRRPRPRSISLPGECIRSLDRLTLIDGSVTFFFCGLISFFSSDAHMPRRWAPFSSGVRGAEDFGSLLQFPSDCKLSSDLTRSWSWSSTLSSPPPSDLALDTYSTFSASLCISRSISLFSSRCHL